MPVSLEQSLKRYAFCEVDTQSPPPFEDHLWPNEFPPHRVKKHLDRSEAGLLVSVGTERSFFDLALMDESKCKGLIVRDINPRVKAYVDYNTLLLRLSITREEYVELSSDKNQLDRVAKKLDESDLPPEIKSFYQKNLTPFANLFYSAYGGWKIFSKYDPCRYDKVDALFYKVQKVAREGNIVATIGPINDLYFLLGKKISVVDTSNVADYSPINLQGVDHDPPTVIQTHLSYFSYNTRYHSYKLQPLTSAEKRKMTSLLRELPSRIQNTFMQHYHRPVLEHLKTLAARKV